MGQRDHLNQFKTSQYEIDILGGVDSSISWTLFVFVEYLDEEGEQHRPDVPEQFTQLGGWESQDQDSYAEQDQN